LPALAEWTMSPASSAVTTATARAARRIDVPWVEKPREIMTKADAVRIEVEGYAKTR